jgi:holin-like protein
MKIIKQVGIIFSLCWLSVVIAHFLPLGIPASIIGLILMLAMLLTGILRLEHVQEKSNFLLSNMSFFFIPPGVNVINYFGVIKSIAAQLIIICVVSTVITFGVTALTVKLTLNLMRRFKGENA